MLVILMRNLYLAPPKMFGVWSMVRQHFDYYYIYIYIYIHVHVPVQSTSMYTYMHTCMYIVCACSLKVWEQ